MPRHFRVVLSTPCFEQRTSTPLSPKPELQWNGVQRGERSVRILADFNGTAHRDVKLFVLHGKVTQF